MGYHLTGPFISPDKVLFLVEELARQMREAGVKPYTGA
jgi:hypothetical protein